MAAVDTTSTAATTTDTTGTITSGRDKEASRTEETSKIKTGNTEVPGNRTDRSTSGSEREAPTTAKHATGKTAKIMTEVGELEATTGPASTTNAKTKAAVVEVTRGPQSTAAPNTEDRTTAIGTKTSTTKMEISKAEKRETVTTPTKVVTHNHGQSTYSFQKINRISS